MILHKLEICDLKCPVCMQRSTFLTLGGGEEGIKHLVIRKIGFLLKAILLVLYVVMRRICEYFVSVWVCSRKVPA